jgi:glycine cleavage system transcriptional repressor
MTRLSGEFAMIVVVSAPAGLAADKLVAELRPLSDSHGLFINCKPVPDAEVHRALTTQYAARYIVSVYGPDKVGLLASLTAVLAGKGVNITDVQTRVAAGGTVYVMIFEVEVPANLGVDTLHDALESVAKDLGVQVSLRPLEEETL